MMTQTVPTSFALEGKATPSKGECVHGTAHIPTLDNDCMKCGKVL